MRALDEIIIRRNNNFDLIRLIAALAVVFGHSFDLFYNKGFKDPVKGVLVTDSTGNLAVCVFFFLSGIFISNSFVNKKSHLQFVSMRLFRIWPALIVCTVITAFGVGCAFTLMPVVEYFKSKETWQFITHSIFLNNVVSYHLPGVFVSNPYPNGVNGSLWTLPIEVKCYCLVLLLGVIRFFKKSVYMLAFFALISLAVLTNNHHLIGFLGLNAAICFVAGMCCFSYRNIIKIDYRIGLVLVLMTFLTYGSSVFLTTLYVALLYNSLVFGSSKLAKNIKLPGDYSYGIYIYGFVVQQSFASLSPALNPYQSMLLTFPCSIVLGVLSWHLIEQPSINFGKSVNYTIRHKH